MDVKEALEAAGRVMLKTRISGVYPTTSEEAAQAVIVAFLERVGEAESVADAFTTATGSGVHYRDITNTPSRILAAIQEAKS